MIVYEETVPLPRFLSPYRSLAHILGSATAAVAFYWSEFPGKNSSWPTLLPAAFIAFDFFPVLRIINGAIFPELHIQIDETALQLKRGFIQKEFRLDSIVEISAVSASRVKKTTVLQHLYQTSDFLFLDRKVSSNVELLLSGGVSKYVATGRPEELTKVLRFQIDRFQRESVFRMVAESHRLGRL